MKNILVVGGAGYIGSHMVRLLQEQAYEVTVFDNLSTGHADAIKKVELVKGDLAEPGSLSDAMASRRFDAVMHFASSIEVGESVLNPAKYYRNNVSNTQNLLDAMVNAGVLTFIFSSTAAVYGNPQWTPIDESHPTAPLNPYGHTKLVVEQMLTHYERAYGLKSICLRYFNAAGAHPSGEIGERHEPESHLIPRILRSAAGTLSDFKIFGTDYDTPDGTCIRDYIHVCDLCDAHLAALRHLERNGQSQRLNLGNGMGYSVQQVIDAARRVTGKEIKVVTADRRAGDPARLVANSSFATELLGWKPHYPDLETIISHAWRFESRSRSR